MGNRRTEDSSTRQSLQVAKIAAMSKLAAGVAHEINNPCGVLLMKLKFLLSIAEQEHLSARAIATLEVAIQQTERIETIVESLVHFSRPLQGMPGPVDVNEAIQAAITQLQLPATVTVRQNLADPLPVVVADPAQMQQVFAHIMDNAVDAMPDGGHLMILSRREVDADQVVIEIDDTGPGIPVDFVDRIFDPFFTTKAVGSETGLGLAVSHGIIQRAGGRIDVESERGKGTRVRVIVPAKELLMSSCST
jgi:signal transduction histidine kinase